MKHILMLCDEDALLSPRPRRMIKMLLDLKNETNLKLSVIHNAKTSKKDFTLKNKVQNDFDVFTFSSLKKRDERSENENIKIYEILKNKEFEKFFFTKNRDEIFALATNIQDSVNIILIENITLLPHALRLKNEIFRSKNIRIALDLREFYPLEYDDETWLDSFGAAFGYLCQKYLKSCDILFSVNESLAKKYMDDFNVKCDFLLSLPEYHNLLPSKMQINDSITMKKNKIDNEKIKALYHGFISADRHSFNLLDIFGNLDRYKLDILALSNEQKFLHDFKTKAQKYKNITILEKIDTNELVAFGNNYDIGMLTLMPNSFNNAHALPNKFFEYLQSRLCIISTPTIEIKKYINALKVGFVSEDFKKESMQKLLKNLSYDDILNAKNNANFYAKKYSLHSNIKKVKEIFGL